MILFSCDSYLLPLLFFKRILLLIQILVPLFLIVFASISIAKLVKNPDEKNGTKKIINKFLAAAIVFFIPLFINIVMSIIGSGTDLSSCWNTVNEKTSVANNYMEIEKKKKNAVYTDPSEYQKGKKKVTNSVTGSKSKYQCLVKGKTSRVLFYGNSKTVGPDGGETIRDNNVAAKFEGIAKSMGYNVIVTTIDEGLGYQSSRLGSAYDCYIDQQCTDCMSSPDGVASAISSRANTLKSHNSNVKIYLRQIWTYCSGGQINNDGGLQTAFSGAEKAASMANVSLIPDGKAMLANREMKTGINVCDDDRHQNNKGAYLIGATIFKSISGESPTKATWYGDVDAGTAKTLLKIADQIG